MKESFNLIRERKIKESQNKIKEAQNQQIKENIFNEKLLKTFIIKECFLKLRENKISEKTHGLCAENIALYQENEYKNK